jgi:hypothetical protein
MASFFQAFKKNLSMKKQLIAFALFGFFALVTTAAQAQALGSNYKTAAGIKFYPGAISVKHFTSKDVALEGLASFWNYGFRFTGLYEYHGDFKNAAGLKWYVGPGAHVGFWNSDWKDRYPGRASGIMIGVDGVLGIDYKIKDAPINLSLDVQPSFNIVGYTYFDVWGGLGIRYTFK